MTEVRSVYINPLLCLIWILVSAYGILEAPTLLTGIAIGLGSQVWLRWERFYHERGGK